MGRAFLPLRNENARSRSESRPATAPALRGVLRLQRLAGNSAIQRVFSQRAEGDAGGGANEQAEVEAAEAAIEALLDPDAIATSLGGGEPLVQRLSIQRQPPATSSETEAPKPGEAGDLLSAVAETKEFKQAAAQVKALASNKLKSDWSKLKAGEKAAVLVTGFTIAGGGLAGALFKPESRKFLESQISGRAIPVPGVDGLSLTLEVKDDKLTGGMVNFNMGAVLPKSLGFQ